MSTVQFLGFIEKTADGKYDVTELGRRFVSDDKDDAAKAAQEGVMRTGFGPLINRFGTGTPNVRAITNLLISDYNVPEAAAQRAAELLVEMAGECRLVVDGRFKPAEIERAQEAAGAVPRQAPQGPTANSSAAKPAAPKPVAAKNSASGRQETAPEEAVRTNLGRATEGGGAAAPFGLRPIVILNVDATKLTAAELAEVVGELRKLGDSS